MPLKLVPPREGKSPFWAVRGTHLGVYLERSTKTPVRAQAAKFLTAWKEEIERGATAKPGEPTFLDAAVVYMADTGNERFIQPLVERLGRKRLFEIDQKVVNETAIALYPKGSAATRNRNCHTVVSAILKHAGHDWKMKRPKGWRGEKKTDWCWPEQVFRLFQACRDLAEEARAEGDEHGAEVYAEFEVFLIVLCYCGMRLSEATARLRCDRVELRESFAYLEKTKNEDPRGVHLPPAVVAALARHPRGLDRHNALTKRGEAVFRFRKNGRLYTLMNRVKKRAGADLSFVTFHVLRHTYGTWMTRYGGLDTKGLVDTGTWKDPESAARYQHTIASEEARCADLLPVDKAWKLRA